MNRPSGSTGPFESNTDKDVELPTLSEFDKYRETLLSIDAEEGWASELRRYLSSMQREVTKDTDLVEWWQVSGSCKLIYCKLIIFVLGSCAIIPHPCAHRA